MFPARGKSRGAVATAAEGRAAGHRERPSSCPIRCRVPGCKERLARAGARRPGPSRRRCHSDPSRRSSAHALAVPEAPPRGAAARRTCHRDRRQAARAAPLAPTHTLRLRSTAANFRVPGKINKATEASAF